MNKPLTVIEKNSREELRVVWGEFRGQQLLNLRIFTDLPNVDERMPTRKGITLTMDQIPEVISALKEAMEDVPSD